MAIVTRYFSTSSAGAGDGTTWADRAALFSAGAWSTVITGFNFASTDSLLCYIGPGNYSITAVLQTASFTNAPTTQNPLFFHGCDSNGNALEVPNLGWSSDMPEWDSSGMPSLNTTTNITTINVGTIYSRLIKFTATSTSTVINAGRLDWCVVQNGSSGSCIGNVPSRNCSFKNTNTTFGSIVAASNDNIVYYNCRVEGNPNASSGDRRGFSVFYSSGREMTISRCSVINAVSSGIYIFGAGASGINIINCLIYNCGDGISAVNSSTSTGVNIIGCIIVDGSSYGILENSSNVIYVSSCRLRNNTSGNISTDCNYPITFSVDTSSGADFDEFVDHINLNLQIKAFSNIWNKGYGPSQQTNPLELLSINM